MLASLLDLADACREAPGSASLRPSRAAAAALAAMPSFTLSPPAQKVQGTTAAGRIGGDGGGTAVGETGKNGGKGGEQRGKGEGGGGAETAPASSPPPAKKDPALVAHHRPFVRFFLLVDAFHRTVKQGKKPAPDAKVAAAEREGEGEGEGEEERERKPEKDKGRKKKGKGDDKAKAAAAIAPAAVAKRDESRALWSALLKDVTDNVPRASKGTSAVVMPGEGGGGGGGGAAVAAAEIEGHGARCDAVAELWRTRFSKMMTLAEASAWLGIY